MSFVTLDQKYRQQFVTDFKLPIQLYENDDDFEYYVNLYDNEFNVKQKIQWYNEGIEFCETKNMDYLQYRKQVINQMISDISESHHSLKTFQLFNAIKDTDTPKFKKNNVYSIENDKKHFVKIDVEKACYTIFKIYNGENVDFLKESYVKFVEQYTHLKAISESKFIRVYIFGQVQPTQIATMIRYFLYQIWLNISQTIPTLKLALLNNDEIIIETGSDSISKINEILQKQQTIYSYFKISSFTLYHLNHEMYLKEHDDGKKELKCVPNAFYAQVYKKVHGMTFNLQDKKFNGLKQQSAYFSDYLDLVVP
jgi:hypothetical protein